MKVNVIKLWKPCNVWDKETGKFNFRNEIIRRIKLNRYLQGKKRLQQIVIEKCKRDPVFFVNNFVWTYDPRTAPHHRPMVLWQKQEHLLNAYCGVGECNKTSRSELRPLVLDKSRDAGASVTCCAGTAHFLLFVNGGDVGIMSRTHKGVHDRTYNSLSGKILYIIDHLPIWMKPQIEERTQPFIIKNLSNGNVILGAATTDGSWRGPRVRRLFIDEAAHVVNLEAVMTSISAATDAPALISSPSFKSHPMYRILTGEEVEVTPYGVAGDSWIRLSMPYSTDPRKDEEWAKNKRKSMTLQAWAQEYELDWTASAPARIWPEFVEEIHTLSQSRYAMLQANSPNHNTTNSLDWVCGWDFGILSLTSCVWLSYCKSSGTIIIHDYRSWREKTVEDIVNEIKQMEKETGIKYFSCRHVGDPAGSARGANLQSWIGEAKKMGVKIKPQRLKNAPMLREKIRTYLAQEIIKFAPNCAVRHNTKFPALTECVSNYRLDIKSGDVAKGDEKPAKDIYSHSADALQYALAEFMENQSSVGEKLQPNSNQNSLFSDWI